MTQTDSFAIHDLPLQGHGRRDRATRKIRVGILPNLADQPKSSPRKPDLLRRWPKLRSSRRATPEQVQAAIDSSRNMGTSTDGMDHAIAITVRRFLIDAGDLNRERQSGPPIVSDCGPAPDEEALRLSLRQDAWETPAPARRAGQLVRISVIALAMVIIGVGFWAMV